MLLISRFFPVGVPQPQQTADDSEESNEGAKNINDSTNIEAEEQHNSLHNEADEVVVEAKRRRKSPPVQIRQHKEDERPPSSALNESPEADVRPTKSGLSLKSPLDLETRNESPTGKTGEESSPDMAGSIQAALAALQVKSL